MKIKSLILTLAVCLTLPALIPNASAIPINLGLTAGNPASPSDELGRLNGVITSYNVAHDPDLALATLAGYSGQIAGSGTSIVLNVTGWKYLMLKWADSDQFYYVGGDTGNLTFNSTVFNFMAEPKSLSHYEFFNPTTTGVPDGGSTVVLLGASMSGLGLIVRRRKA